MEKIYRVQMNSKGMPNFSTAVEIDTEISEYSDKLWKNAYERGKADRPQDDCSTCEHYNDVGDWCKTCGMSHYTPRMKGADDEDNH